MEKTKVIIEVLGGVVQAVYASRPDSVDIHIYAFDHSVDETEEERQEVVDTFERDIRNLWQIA